MGQVAEAFKARAREVVANGLVRAVDGLGQLRRKLDEIEKVQVADEIRRYRLVRDPDATVLQIYKFASRNPREMRDIVNTPLDDYERSNAEWAFMREMPDSTLVARIERNVRDPRIKRINARIAAAGAG